MEPKGDKMVEMSEIPLRRLGRTELEVTPIGLGVMQFSGGSGMMGMAFPDIPEQEKNAIVKAALDGGINWFDTAEMYGRGTSEQALADALKAAEVQDGDVVIGTKWFPMFRTAGNIPRTIEDRIRFLDGYTIDLYMVHQPWSFSSPETEMDALADLVEAGKIRNIGVSNFSAQQMERAQSALEQRGLSLAVNQVQYSLLHRKIESNGVLDAAKDMDITIVAWSPLARGTLTGMYRKNPDLINSKRIAWRLMMRRHIERSGPVVDALQEIADKHDVVPGQVALNWLVNFQGESVVAIPGASKVYQAEQNAGAMKINLSDEEMARLDELSRGFRN
jgi:aryl-alcohol dehydrogenase-like predicted oxidoreductase